MIFVQSPIRSNWLIMCFQIGDVMHDSKAFVRTKCLRTCAHFTANNDTESICWYVHHDVTQKQAKHQLHFLIMTQLCQLQGQELKWLPRR